MTLEIQQLFKRQAYGSFINPVPDIGDGVLNFDVMMKHALCIDLRTRGELSLSCCGAFAWVWWYSRRKNKKRSMLKEIGKLELHNLTSG